MTSSVIIPNVINNNTSVKYNCILGRYLIAKKKINYSDILIEELPFVIGPICNSKIVCLNCYKPVKCEYCFKCKWPLCKECNSKINSYHQFECKIFQDAKVKFFPMENDSNGCPQLDCITTLRVLLSKEENSERWEKEVAQMEHHTEARKAMTEIWNADLVNIAQYLRGPCKLYRFSEELIMQVVGILEVNAFEGRTSKGFPIRCLYPITGILAHNCVPNTARSIYPSEEYRIRLRAMKDLDAGEQLHHSYTYTLYGTAARQEHLKKGKFFTCHCKRCIDPTELGTNFSTFKCNKCEDGWIFSTNAIDSSAEWKCTVCEFKTPGTAIQKAIDVMNNEVNDIQAMEIGPERLQETEKLLRTYRSVLHPLHFIQTGLRQNLIEMYGRVKGYELVELPDVLLERKEELCRQVLRVLNIFEPGLSRARALMLYELHVPVVLLAKSTFIAGVMTGEALKSKLKEAIELLDECYNILKYEDPSMQEGVLGNVAKQAHDQLCLSVEGLGE